jgi:acetolactate synthase-1/2/3 large subunit
MRLADYLMQFVAQQGVKHVFLLPGGGAMHLNDALARCEGLTFVCNHHEQASAIAAENYSKATNNLGVALVTTGPGGTNAITGLVGAWLDSTPMLVISGQVKRADRMYHADGTPLGVRQRGSQEVDIVSLVKPVTKYAVTIGDPQSIRYHLEKSVYLARTGRPGPVWVDIPIDVQAAPVEPDAMQGFDPSEFSQPASNDLAAQIRDLMGRLKRAHRPFIFAGNGVRVSGAAEAFEKLVRRLNVPVGLTWMAMDLLDDDDPLLVGRPGTVASRAANFALQNADFVLVIGARLDPPLMGWDPQQFAREAYKTVVDIDPAELRKLEGAIDNPICADARIFIDALLQESGRGTETDQRQCKTSESANWIEQCQEWKARYPLVLPEHRAPGLVSLYHLAEIIGQEVGPDDRVVSGSSGSAIEVFLLAYRARKGRRVFHTAGLGAMGYGLPASIGVCLGSGGRKTICVDGDGGLQLNIQELATIAHLQLPIKLFVLNNQGYASIRASQTNYFGGPNIGCDSNTGLTIPDYRKVARAYGLKTAVIEGQGGDSSDLREAVREILSSDGPLLCDVHVIPDEIRAPRVTSIQRADGSFVSKPLEDLWPFLDRGEFAENMIVEPVCE